MSEVIVFVFVFKTKQSSNCVCCLINLIVKKH
jgi:hypothetical protein